MNPSNEIEKQLPTFLRNVINKAVEEATSQELEEAKKRIDKRKSEIIAGVVLHVQRQMQIETAADMLIIKVSNK